MKTFIARRSASVVSAHSVKRNKLKEKHLRKGNFLMNRKKHFEKYYSQLLFEAWLNSILIAFAIGLFAGFVVAAVYWFLPMKGLLLSVLTALGCTVVAAPIFFFAKYRPTLVSSARRLDRLGLEERLVTMVEYENDSSFIAKVQREDAQESLAKLELSRVGFIVAKLIAVPKPTLILLLVALPLFIVMNTVGKLSDEGILPGGDFIIDAIIPEEQIEYVEVLYEVDGGGEIYGESIQLVPIGGKTEEVVAVADDEWIFSHWEEDEYKKPARSDSKITESTIFTAVFIQTGDGDQTSDQDDPNAQPSDDGKPKDKPQQNQENQENKDDQQNQENQENQDDQQQQKPEDNDQNKPSNQGGSRYEEANKVIDGEKYYKDEIEETYYEELRKRLEEEGDQLTAEERHLIESYLDTLRGSKAPAESNP